MSLLKVNNLQDLGADPIVTGGTLAKDAFPSGTILQIISTTKTDTFSASVASGGTSGEVTGLTATITPSSTTNKVLVQYSLNLSHNGNSKGIDVILLRGGTALTDAVGSSAGSRVSVTSGSYTGNNLMTTSSGKYLDSPGTTSEITYSFSLHNGDNSSATLNLNRSHTDTDTNQFARSVSTITLMEVAG